MDEIKHEILMMPEPCALFWEDGCVIGDDTGISIGDTSYEFAIPGLTEWLWLYVWSCFVPCDLEELTPEELNRKFDWKEFHRQGLSFAAKIKQILPADVALLYIRPGEDCSGTIPDEQRV